MVTSVDTPFEGAKCTPAIENSSERRSPPAEFVAYALVRAASPLVATPTLCPTPSAKELTQSLGQLSSGPFRHTDAVITPGVSLGIVFD